jgi:hemerythrin
LRRHAVDALPNRGEMAYREHAMPLVKWDSSFEFGIAAIDTQHQQLFQLTNSLHQAITEDTSARPAAQVIEELVGYAKEHFSYEERLLRLYSYDSKSHSLGHERFRAQVLEFKQRLAAGDTALNVHLTYFLRNWLTEHIKGTDAQYVPYLKSKGVR